MNWSRSVVAFSGVCARAHPPGVAPEASVECLDSSEVFWTLYRGMLLYRGVFCPFSFEVWLSAVELPSLMRMKSIRVLAVFYRSTLTLLFLRKGGGVGNVVLPSLGNFRRSPVSC
jgi:hypothetical protein